MARVRALCEEVALNKGLVQRFAVIEGDDDVPYVNINFKTADLPALWGRLRSEIYEDGKIFGRRRHKGAAPRMPFLAYYHARADPPSSPPEYPMARVSYGRRKRECPIIFPELEL